MTAAHVSLATASSGEKLASGQPLDQSVREIIGEDNFRTAVRENDEDQKTIAAFAARLNTPAYVASSATDLRERLGLRSQAIATDPTLSVEEKSKQLKALSDAAQRQLVNWFGDEAGQIAYGVLSWTAALREGKAYSIDPAVLSVRLRPGSIITLVDPTSRNTSTRP